MVFSPPSPSQRLLTALQQGFPAWGRFLAAGFPAEIPSPSGEPNRKLVIWLDEGEPSLSWSQWHTHASCLPGAQSQDPDSQEQAFLELLRGIVEDRLVLAEEIGEVHPGAWTLLDLGDENSLLEEITSPYSSGRIRLHTWTGSGDQDLGPEDLVPGTMPS